MTDFAAIYKRTSDFLLQFRDLKREAEENASLECDSATIIQRVFRGVLSRSIINIKGGAVLEIQRVFRGHVGRKCFHRAQADLYQYKQHARVRFFIIYIQRCFRGYYSRRYKQNFASRKKYVEFIVGRAADVREQLNRYADQQSQRMRVEAEQHAAEEFRTLAQDLHHLVGTRSIRGIYNPNPYLMGEPTAQAVPIEEHLRGIVRDLLRTTGRTSHRGGLVRDINGTAKIPYKGMLNKLSIQASAPYDAVKEEERKAKVLHKVLTVDREKEFIPCRKADQRALIPASADDPFLDKWANPFFTRGVPQNEAQLKESVIQRKPLFAQPTDPHHHWYHSTSGNKSAAHPNNTFDVIHEANITGGTARRHLGRSTRLGVPPAADNRGFEGSTLAGPPLKDSKILYGANGVFSRSTLFSGGRSTTLQEPRGAGKLQLSASADFSSNSNRASPAIDYAGIAGSPATDSGRRSTDSLGAQQPQQHQQHAQTQQPQRVAGPTAASNPAKGARTFNVPRGLKAAKRHSSSTGSGMIVKVRGLLPMPTNTAAVSVPSSVPSGDGRDPAAVDPYYSSDED